MNAVVDRYFAAMDRHDWVELRSCLSDSFRRVGPYEEHVWDDPDDYLVFLQTLIEQGPMVHVNVTETIAVEGSPHVARVAVTFRMSPHDQIEDIEVFVRRPSPAGTVT
jgi:SnoaL-like domain